MKKLRQIHLYLGVLFAPSILFFAFTGAYQTFRWNENGVAGALEPALSQMAAIHKNAALPNGERRRKPRPQAAPKTEKPAATEAEAEAKREAENGESPRRDRALPLKIYIFLMSLGLIASTATGVALAFKTNRSSRLIWGLLAVGTVLPLGLLFV